MATSLLFDEHMDLYLSDVGPVEVSGLDEIKQSLNSILMTNKGSWEDDEVGMDNSWLIGGYDENAAVSAIEQALKQDKRVTNIIQVNPSYDANNHVVDFYIEVNTTLGQLDFRKEVKVNALN